MEEITFTCTFCDKDGLRDEIHGEADYEAEVFECNACYGKRMDDLHADAHAAGVRYSPHAARAAADPVGFYIACKDAPETL